jgi:hypothetical protein
MTHRYINDPTKPWCISWIHRDSKGFIITNSREWCMAASQPKGEKKYQESIKTACGYFIIATGGIDRREPTCSECLDKLNT